MQKLRSHPYEILLWLFIIGYTVFFSFISIDRYKNFSSHYYDLGIMDQVVYNTSQGRFLEMTNQDLKRNTSRFSIHFDPILAVFAPFYRIWPDPAVLLIGQAGIIALGALAVYLFAMLKIKKKPISLLFALSYLSFFAVQRQTIFDFHGVTLATTFLLFAIYFSVKKSLWPAYVFILLSLLTKENIGLVTFMFGLYLFFAYRMRRFGAVVMATSVAFFVASVFVIIPHYRQAAHFALKYYGDFGDSPSHVILGMIRHPLLILHTITEADHLAYIGRFLLANGVLFIFAPLEFLLSAPEFLINLLSNSPNMRDIYFHYNAVIIPFMMFASILGYIRLMKLTKKHKGIHAAVLPVVIVLNIVSAYLYNPFPVSLVREPFYYASANPEKIKAVHMWAQKLASDHIKVATTPQLAPYFTNRRYYYNFLFDPAVYSIGYTDSDIIKNIDSYEQADFIVIARSELSDDKKVLKLFHDHVQGNPKYHRIYDKNDLEVYTNDLNRTL